MPYKPDKSRYWYASYKDARGVRVRKSTGSEDYDAAAALEGQWKADVWRQKNWGERPRYTFPELIEAYLDANEHQSSAERQIYSAKALAPYFSDCVIADINAQDIANYKRDRLLEVSVGTVIKELGFFSAAINYSNTEWDWNLPNVVAGRIPAQPEGRIRWLTIEETQQLLLAAHHPRSAPYLPQLIRLALHTGMRHRELLQLTWNRIDWRQRLIYFDPRDHKSRRMDSLPLNDAAVSILKSLWAARESFYTTREGRITQANALHVFTFRGKPIASVKKSFASACRRADIEDATVHDLRHTFASRLVQAGVPIATVKETMRHRSIQTTMRYAHLAPQNTRDAVATLDRYDQTQTHTSTNQGKTA